VNRTRGKRRWPKLLAFLACLALCALLVWQLPAFRLQKIEIPQLRSLDESEILAVCGLEDGQHLFIGLGGTLEQIIQFRYPDVEARLLEKLPAIKTAEARMKFPGTISLEITERIEVAYISIPDGCVMIDKEGVALKILDKPPAGIPVIEGVTATSLVLGQPLGVDVPAAMNSAITLMGAIIDADKDARPGTLLLPQISKIRPISGRRLYLTAVLPKTGEELSVEAETGQDQTEDMLWLRFALDQGAFDSRGKGVLDLTGSRKTFTPD